MQSFSRKSQDSACWPGVYRLCVSLMESLLKTLRYNFINEALDFVGVHQERILQVEQAITHPATGFRSGGAPTSLFPLLH